MYLANINQVNQKYLKYVINVGKTKEKFIIYLYQKEYIITN